MRRTGWTAAALAGVLVADVLALQVLAPPAPRPVADAVLEFREAAPPRPAAAGRPRVPPAGAPAAAPGPRGTGPAAPAAPRPAAPPPAAPTTAAVPAPLLPEPGVYAYATQGSEQVELLGTDRHDYPTTTAVTVRRTACGVDTRWEPVQGRVERRSECRTPGGLELASVTSVHRFLRITDERAFACPAAAVVVVPVRPVAGTTSSGTCTGSGGDTLTLTTTVVATGLRERVGGEPVELVRLRVTGLLDGDETGRSTEDRWVTSAGLVVRSRTVTTGEQATPLGTARYTEDVALRLTALRPQR